MSRALVLGSGGVTGVAWELGLLAGLADAGIDLTAADLLVGTSAGSVVGAQIASGIPLDRLYAAQLKPASGELGARTGLRFQATWLWIALTSRTHRHRRMRLGRRALAARTVPEVERRRVMESRIGVRDWPDRPLLITAVEATAGEFRAFDRDSGVPLLDAVGASCAVPMIWPPVTIDGQRWIDGGARSSLNADLASGYEQVVMLAPLPLGTRREVAKLAARARVVVVAPDREARRAIGRNVLDPAHRAAAARAGRVQAAREAERVSAVWS